MKCVKPQGAFYIFPKVPWGNDQEFVKTSIENKVLIVPGSACSERNTHFRLSFAASDENIKRGIEILQRLAKMK
jgi:aspartate aminotransferase/aminotransferase